MCNTLHNYNQTEQNKKREKQEVIQGSKDAMIEMEIVIIIGMKSIIPKDVTFLRCNSQETPWFFKVPLVW